MTVTKKNLFSWLLCMVMLVTGLTGCSDSDEAEEGEEDIEVQTLTIEDEDYYTRFKGDDIEINIYNWGE